MKPNVILDSGRLRGQMLMVMADLGVTDESALAVVESLVQTSLRGVDSHGINLFPHYCNAIQSGRISKSPNLTIDQRAASVAILDANHAFGHYAGTVAMAHAVKMAGDTGMGSVAVNNSSHFGAAAYFALQAAEQGYLGFSFTNADALVKAWGSTDAFFGTNPVCFTAPLANEGPFCLDMATSKVSWNKINNYKRNEMPLDDGWACDSDGRTVTDPQRAVSLHPVGDYKGFGLGMMVDILCAVLTGGIISKDLDAMYADISKQRRVSHFFMAIDVSKFIAVDLFKVQLQQMVDRIRVLPSLDNAHMMVGGDPEKITFKQRSLTGIPMDRLKYDEYLAVSPSFQSVLLSS